MCGERPPAPPAPPQVPEPEWVHGKYQSVISHLLPALANGSLIMEDLQGDITVLGTDVEQLEIREIIRIKGVADADEARQIVSGSTGALVIEIPGQPATYRFTAVPREWRHMSFDYLVQVPRPFSVAGLPSVSTVSCSLRIVAVGLKAARITMFSPFEIPP